MSQTNTNNSPNTTSDEYLYLTFVVDRSGSMTSCGVAVFTGIKEFIEKKTKFAEEQDKTICLTIFTFDHEIKRLDIPTNPTELTTEHYEIIKKGVEPRGWTRLYDTIHKAAMYTTTLQEKSEEFNSRGFMVIITDGEDNTSDIKREDLKREIESHTKTGMEYVFIGANIDAAQTGSRLGISANACMQFTPDPTLTQNAFSNLGIAMQRSVENEDEEFQFSQLERQTSCNPIDRKRFNVDSVDPVDPVDPVDQNTPAPDEPFLSMDEILKLKKKNNTNPFYRRTTNTHYFNPSDLPFVNDIFPSDTYGFKPATQLFENDDTTDNTFASGVTNLMNLSFLNNTEKETDK